MIIGVGVDIADVSRIAAILGKGEAFKKRVFTEKEITYCESKKNTAERFAARFAAKEAFFKALGTGCINGLRFIDVEVVNDDLGKPTIRTYARAKEMIIEKKVQNIHLSLSHTTDNAIAYLILED